jgi:hypothetical protein
MRGLDLEKIARQARLPGSEMIPADHALRSLLGLKPMPFRNSHYLSWDASL